MPVKKCSVNINSKRQELTKHGTLSFPAAAYEDDFEAMSVEYHWHDELEAMFVTEGRGVVEVNARKFEIHEGEGFFINSGVLHSAYKTGEKFKVHAVVFHSDLISGNNLSVFNEKYITPLLRGAKFLRIQRGSESMKLLSEAWDTFKRENFGYEFEIRSRLSKFLVSILQNFPAASKISLSEQRSIERIKTMLTFVRENFSESIDVREIAASASISESECLRCFHKILNTTPVRYLRNYRLRKAEYLLVSTDDNIADVAASCGFQEISYFTKIFREKNKITPSGFRKINRRIFNFY